MKLFFRKKRINAEFIPLPVDAGGVKKTMFVSPGSISAFTPDYKGRDITHIAINGDVYAIDLPIEQFILTLTGYGAKIKDHQDR